MKEIYVKPISPDKTEKLEKLLNQFRIGLNDWDRTKVLNYNGRELVVYTVVCEKDTWVSISNLMKN